MLSREPEQAAHRFTVAAFWRPARLAFASMSFASFAPSSGLRKLLYLLGLAAALKLPASFVQNFALHLTPVRFIIFTVSAHDNCERIKYMKVAVFSDTHSNNELMLEAVRRCRPDAAIHLGDHDRDAVELRHEFQGCRSTASAATAT